MTDIDSAVERAIGDCVPGTTEWRTETAKIAPATLYALVTGLRRQTARADEAERERDEAINNSWDASDEGKAALAELTRLRAIEAAGREKPPLWNCVREGGCACWDRSAEYRRDRCSSFREALALKPAGGA